MTALLRVNRQPRSAYRVVGERSAPPANATPFVPRRTEAARLALCLLLVTAAPGESQTPADPLTVISTEGRQSLPTVAFDGRQMIALRELVAPFRLVFGDDRQPGRLTILRDNAVMVLTADDGIVSVAGRLVSLPSPPVERAGVWYVPIDFIGRALPLVHDQHVELRRRSGLVVIGDIRVPQVVARYQRSGRQSRLRLLVTPAAEHIVEQTPDRLVVTFAADAIDLVPPDIAPDDLVRSLDADETRPRLMVGLGNTFGTYATASEPALGGSVELIIELQPRAGGAARVDPPPGRPPPTSVAADTDPDLPPLLDLAPSSAIRAIAIDPGHGGEDTGTRGPDGTLEKEVTLRIARRLRSAIEQRLGLRVVLTRNDDTAVTLDERAAIANNNRADLFISLHTNASVRETATGAEVFYLSLAGYDEHAREAAGFSGQPVPVAGGGSRMLDIVPWEMTQLRFVDQSARWAQTVADELSLRLPMSPRGLQQAPFRVLVGANMPAVLVELGFISNPDQEAQLASTTFQTAIVNGLLRSIIRYRDEEQRGGPPDPPASGSPNDGDATRRPLQ